MIVYPEKNEPHDPLGDSIMHPWCWKPLAGTTWNYSHWKSLSFFLLPYMWFKYITYQDIFKCLNDLQVQKKTWSPAQKSSAAISDCSSRCSVDPLRSIETQSWPLDAAAVDCRDSRRSVRSTYPRPDAKAIGCVVAHFDMSWHVTCPYCFYWSNQSPWCIIC